MSRAGFVVGLLVMVQGAVGQSPIIVGLYEPSPTLLVEPISLEEEVWVDIPQTEKVVTMPSGTAVMTWEISNVGAAQSAIFVRPVIGDVWPPEVSFYGSWVTPVDGGTVSVKLQVRSRAGTSFIDYDSTSFLNWSLIVIPDIPSNVPAISGIGLLVMVAGLVAAAGFVLRRRAALLQ